MGTVLLGRQSAGTTTDFSTAGNTAAWKFTAVASGTLGIIWANTKTVNTASAVRLGIYDDSAGSPVNLLGVGTVVTADGNSAVAHSALITPGVNIVSGTDYWLGWFASVDNRDFQGDSAGSYFEGAGNFQNPWPGGSPSSVNAIIWGEEVIQVGNVFIPHRMPLGV